jgi:hypothetical protein
MKRTLAVMMAVVLFGSVARGEDLAKEYLERLVGQWHSRWISGQEKGFGLMSCQFADDRATVVLKEKLFGLDFSSPWSGRALVQHTNRPNSFKMCYSAEEGAQFEDKVTVTKVGAALAMKGIRKGVGGDGKAISGDCTIDSPDADHITLKMTNCMTGGKKEPDFVLSFTRVKHNDLAK